MSDITTVQDQNTNPQDVTREQVVQKDHAVVDRPSGTPGDSVSREMNTNKRGHVERLDTIPGTSKGELDKSEQGNNTPRSIDVARKNETQKDLDGVDRPSGSPGNSVSRELNRNKRGHGERLDTIPDTSKGKLGKPEQGNNTPHSIDVARKNEVLIELNSPDKSVNSNSSEHNRGKLDRGIPDTKSDIEKEKLGKPETGSNIRSPFVDLRKQGDRINVDDVVIDQTRDKGIAKSIINIENLYIEALEQLDKKFPNSIKIGIGLGIDDSSFSHYDSVRKVKNAFSNWVKDASFSDLVTARDSVHSRWMEMDGIYCYGSPDMYRSDALLWINRNLELAIFRKNPFDNIRRNEPGIYKDAEKAWIEYNKVKSFQNTYELISTTTFNTIVNQKNGKIYIEYNNVQPEFIKAIEDGIKGELIEFIGGKRLATAATVVFMVKDVIDLSETERIMKDPAKLRKFALSHNITILANDNARKNPGIDRHAEKIRLYNQYKNYEKALYRYLYFEQINEKYTRGEKRPNQPTIR